MDKHGDTPVFVLATVGLRRLVVEDARWVLEEVDAVVKEYRMGRFDNSLRLSTLGLLDLGCLSLQVVMEVDELRGDIHFMRSRIGRFEHKIAAYSLPAFGLNAAFDRAVAMLSHATMQTESIDGNFEVSHPCLSSNFMQNYTCTSCFQQKTMVRERIGQSSLVYLVGNPNWEECKKLARATSINSSDSDWSKLASGSNLKGSLSSHSGNNILNFTGGQLSSRFHAFSSIQNYAGLFCFHLSYILSLIEDALCLRDKEMIFGPPDISWTLGSALVEGKFLWLNTAQAEPGFWTSASKVVSSPVLIFVLLVILSLIVYCSQLKLPMPGKKADAGISLPSYANTGCRPN
ncbi:hypothetical protein RJ641_009151 [Dillenia turbinata]|uniref:Uncharacterized protein n=1 Tax=Dillenia turbinata TaxID=194707 RepID=A0AAN8Z724_9MAGN